MPFFYSLHRSKRILKQSALIYKKKRNQLSETERKHFFDEIEKLCDAIANKNRKNAIAYAKNLEKLIKEKYPKSLFEQIKEFVLAVAVAVIIAFVIREFWFELYEVPTGSMRPTINEQDRLIVSKTTFGFHIPFQNRLVLFKPEYLKRNGIIVFTVEGMDVSDAKARYFYLFPGFKRYIKRGIGNPGDILYFYGGRIYGIDKNKNPITELSDENTLRALGISSIDHIPYISFEGKVALSEPLSTGVYASALFQQMNLPLGKLTLKNNGSFEGRFFDGKNWIKDDPLSLNHPHLTPKSYGEMWGIKNYAMARLLSHADYKRLYPEKEEINDGELILELHHTPNLALPPPQLMQDDWGRIYPMITPFTTFIPLGKNHIEKIQKGMTTSRFNVQDGRAYKYQEGGGRPQPAEYDPLFPKVPDGRYEFENGTAYEILFGGIRRKLPLNHPLYSAHVKNIQKLFNLGINFNILFDPHEPIQPFLPQRFAYFREGDLYVMGKPILTNEDPTLKSFINGEKVHAQSGGYVPFVDSGPPLKEGKLDIPFIEAFGLKIPDNGVLALGDNYAMSADSRDFGFVPLQNLRGAPSFIFWPFGSNFGTLPQAVYPLVTLPHIIILIILIIVLVLLMLLYFVRNRPIYFKKFIDGVKE